MRHIPVLKDEVLNFIPVKPDIKVVDCTLGDAGHSELILEKMQGQGKLLGIDADVESVLRAKHFLYRFEDQTIFVRDNFKNLSKILKENDFEDVDFILADFGWSTPQFKERGRGFSFEGEEPLDMRYSNDQDKTAKYFVNNLSVEELSKIFSDFGEEKFAKDIAVGIGKQRKTKEIDTNKELSNLILQVYREKLNSTKEIPWIGGLHPSTKVFQALRIAVNEELSVIKEFLPQAVDSLSKGGRLAVITFHSLEDRIVKHYFQSIDNKKTKFLNKKPISASEEEKKENPSSRSAKLRVVEKI